MIISGSRKGIKYRKRINPFKEDTFALGMTLLQLSSFYREEDLLGVKDLILNKQYEEAFADIKYSFMIKAFLRWLLENDSEQRPDLITAKKIFNQLFMLQDFNYDMNDILENSIKLDRWTCSSILEYLETHKSDSKQKSITEISRETVVEYDTPKPSDMVRSKSKGRIMNPLSNVNLDDYYPDTILPQRLDEKFSKWIEVPEQKVPKSKVTEFLEKVTESNPRVLPFSKDVNFNPFWSKTIMCSVHKRPATKAWMLLHYGEYFCDYWNHECGEMEDIEQSDKVRKNALKNIISNHKDLISKVESLNKRRIEGEDIDIIFYLLFESIKMIHQDVLDKFSLKDSYFEMIIDFSDKLKNASTELKSIKNELDYMYQK